jgi:hypothetical protein
MKQPCAENREVVLRYVQRRQMLEPAADHRVDAKIGTRGNHAIIVAVLGDAVSRVRQPAPAMWRTAGEACARPYSITWPMVVLIALAGHGWRTTGLDP